VELDEKVMAEEASRYWWVFLVTGIVWLMIGFVVLRLDFTSVATVGFLIGGMLVVATVDEAMMASASNGAWKFLHYALAVIFLFGAVWSFINPGESFFTLASVLGFVLFFMGALEIMTAIASKEENPQWVLTLIIGILMILLAIWVSQSFIPARAALLLVWVGFLCIFRGIGHIVMGFGVRKVGKEMMAPAAA
jgi:uncharacterized membrane protein HdeD (DUF308 family)